MESLKTQESLKTNVDNTQKQGELLEGLTQENPIKTRENIEPETLLEYTRKTVMKPLTTYLENELSKEYMRECMGVTKHFADHMKKAHNGDRSGIPTILQCIKITTGHENVSEQEFTPEFLETYIKGLGDTICTITPDMIQKMYEIIPKS